MSSQGAALITTFTKHTIFVSYMHFFYVILMNSNRHLVFKLHTRVLCVLHNCTQNNMEQQIKKYFLLGMKIW